MPRIHEKFIGCDGISCVLQSLLGVLVFEIFATSMMRCLVSRCGVCFMKRRPSYTRFSELSIFLQVTYIFRADLNPRSSFAWKSIMQVRGVISNGARWRIGNGKDIRIWQHRWLPSLGGGRVLSPQLGQSLISVRDLFIPRTKAWDFELIN